MSREGLQALGDFLFSPSGTGEAAAYSESLIEYYGGTFRGSDKESSDPGVTNGPEI